LDPAAEAVILNADDRPYRDGAAAACEEDGRSVDHVGAIRPGPVFVKVGPFIPDALWRVRDGSRGSKPRVCAGGDPESTDDRQIAGFHAAGITR
jgi:hypothetical protein